MLRPGGIFLFADGDLQLYNERFESLPLCGEFEEDFSALQRIFFAYASRSRHACINQLLVFTMRKKIVGLMLMLRL